MTDLDTVSVEQVRVLIGISNHIIDHSHREYEKGGYEAVGLLAGKENNPMITTAVELANHSPDPTTNFFVEPWEQFRATRKLEEAGYEVRGVYHSHPTGEAQPSGSDEKLAAAGTLLMIHSVPYLDINAWREHEGKLHRVDLKFIDPE